MPNIIRPESEVLDTFDRVAGLQMGLNWLLAIWLGLPAFTAMLFAKSVDYDPYLEDVIYLVTVLVCLTLSTLALTLSQPSWTGKMKLVPMGVVFSIAGSLLISGEVTPANRTAFLILGPLWLIEIIRLNAVKRELSTAKFFMPLYVLSLALVTVYRSFEISPAVIELIFIPSCFCYPGVLIHMKVSLARYAAENEKRLLESEKIEAL